MLVYDDVSLDEKIQLYDKGIAELHEFLESPESFAEFQFQIRRGSKVVPTVKFGEPLQAECRHFVDCIRENRQPLTDGLNGLRVVQALEAAEKSLRQDGTPVDISTSS